MHSSRQLFIVFLLTNCMAHVSAVSVASDTAVTNATATAKKHRTPFIVPMSPPLFGDTPTLLTKSDERQFTRGPWNRNDEETFENRSAPYRAIALLPDATDVDLEFTTWPSRLRLKSASQIIADDTQTIDTQSKVVGVTSPNATALSERITVHNLNVAAMEDQLQAQNSWTLEEIEAAYEQLSSIEENRRIWTMYYDLLEPRKQRRIGSPNSLAKCRELFRQRIFETQVTLQINQFAVTKLDLEIARARLEELSDLLQD